VICVTPPYKHFYVCMNNSGLASLASERLADEKAKVGGGTHGVSASVEAEKNAVGKITVTYQTDTPEAKAKAEFVLACVDAFRKDLGLPPRAQQAPPTGPTCTDQGYYSFASGKYRLKEVDVNLADGSPAKRQGLEISSSKKSRPFHQRFPFNTVEIESPTELTVDAVVPEALGLGAAYGEIRCKFPVADSAGAFLLEWDFGNGERASVRATPL
jgi:hypothetical protein